VAYEVALKGPWKYVRWIWLLVLQWMKVRMELSSSRRDIGRVKNHRDAIFFLPSLETEKGDRRLFWNGISYRHI